MRVKVEELTAGRWEGILAQLGIDRSFLSGKHGPCPMCGGKDRWRFDDKEGRGTWFCNNCGAGDGFALLKAMKGWGFADAAKEIRKVIGATEIKKPMIRDREAEKKLMADTWAAALPLSRGDPVMEYLASRKIRIDPASLNDLRSTGTEMLALMRDPVGRGGMIHRTLIGARGAKLFMSGTIPAGGAVRLLKAGEVLGIAEGIETALSAAILHQVPCWAALSAGEMEKWMPPAGVKQVIIFGDNDESFTGQAAAYYLAKRLQAMKLSVRVAIPDSVGDWNDVLKGKIAT